LIGAYNVWKGIRKMHTRFWWGNLKVSDDLEDLRTDGR